MWQTITTAPFGCDLELAVFDKDGPHPLVFPCRRISDGWIDAHAGKRVEVSPTHWQVEPE